MINVVQILLGDCPPFIAKCMQTVKLFAERNAYTYRVINTVPPRYAGNTDFRSVSEHVRFDILASEENTLYVDWDIKLFDNFSIPDGLSFDSQTPDCLVYNHTDTVFFRSARETVTDGTPLILFRGMLNIVRAGYKYSIFNRDMYKHYEYNANKGFLDGHSGNIRSQLDIK